LEDRIKVKDKGILKLAEVGDRRQLPADRTWGCMTRKGRQVNVKRNNAGAQGGWGKHP